MTVLNTINPKRVALLLACCCLVWIAALIFQLHALGFTVLYVMLASSPLLMARSNSTVDFFRPVIGLSVLLYLYSISTLLFINQAGATYYGEMVDASDLATYKAACLLGIAGLSWGAYLGSRMTSFPAYRVSNHRQLLFLVAGVVGLLAIPFIAHKFLPGSATAYGDVALSSRVEHMADSAAGLKEIFLETIPLTLILCAATIVFFSRKHRFIFRAIAAALLSLYFTTTMLSGWRSQFIVGVLIVAVYFHYRVRRVRVSEILLGSIVVYLLVNLLSVMRASSDPIEMFNILKEVVGDRGFEFLALHQSGELATSTNLVRLIQGIRLGESDFGWGSVALQQLAAFVPRPLLPDRTGLASELFVKTFYPGVYESGAGYGFFLPQEGYWDFGLAGVLVYCFLFSFLLERLYRRLISRFASELYVFLYALLYSELVLSAIRSGIVASVKAALIASAPILIVIFLFKPLRPLMRSRTTPE